MSNQIFGIILGLVMGVTGSVFALDQRYDARFILASDFKSFSDSYELDQKLRYAEKVRSLNRSLKNDPGNEDLIETRNEYLSRLCNIDPVNSLCLAS